MKNSIVSGLLIAICVMGDSFLYASLPSSASQLGLSVEAVAIILSINRWVRVFAGPLSNWFYKNTHPKTLLTTSVLLSVLTTASYAFHLSFSVWILSRVLWGFAFALLRLSMVQIATTNQNSSLQNLSIGTALQETGPMISYLLGAFLLSAHFTSQAVFATYAFCALVGLYLVSRISFPGQLNKTQGTKASGMRQFIYLPSSSAEWITFMAAMMTASVPILLPEIWKLHPTTDFTGPTSFSSTLLALQRGAYLLPAILFLFWRPQKAAYQLSFLALIFSFASLSLQISPIISVVTFLVMVPYPRLLSFSNQTSSLETSSRLTSVHDFGLALGPLCGSFIAGLWFF